MEAEDVFDGGFVGPGGGACVPGPAAAARVLGIGVDVGGDAVGFDLILEDVGEGGGAVDGVDDGVEVVGFVVVSLVEFSHDVPHGAVGVLAAVFADTDGVVGDVAWGGDGGVEGRGEELDDFVRTVDETVVGFVEDGLFLGGGGDVGEDGPSLADEVDLAFGVVAEAREEQ